MDMTQIYNVFESMYTYTVLEHQDCKVSITNEQTLSLDAYQSLQKTLDEDKLPEMNI